MEFALFAVLRFSECMIEESDCGSFPLMRGLKTTCTWLGMIEKVSSRYCVPSRKCKASTTSLAIRSSANQVGP